MNTTALLRAGLGLAVSLAWPLTERAAAAPSAEKPITVRVHVLSFDPRVKSADGQRLHRVLGYNEPTALAYGYLRDIKAASGGYVQPRIVSWRAVDAYPLLEGDWQWTEEEFLEAARSGKWPDVRVDYRALIKRYRLAEKVDSGVADEFWFFGAPGFGYYEAASFGPGAFYINGGVYPDVQVSRPFAIMGFSYERGVAEMLHDLAHRTEGTMTHVYGGWNFDYATGVAGMPETNWERFAAASAGVETAGAGNCHWPPNAEKEYDYDNPREVLSAADDFLSYPDLTGATTPVSAETWGGVETRYGPDYQRGYMKWWFGHLPRAEGTGPDGRLNNWWKYVFGFNLAGGPGI